MRTIVARRSQKTGEVQIIFVTSARISLDGQVWPAPREELSKRMGINGEGIASYHGRLVFVPYALPTEEILAEITENARNFSRA
ncbi:hypothetical protein, partial [Lactococcus petauri]|uniref:hypothetical protein n=1 Tax=Lactococcus petauri TaxID=1940789 RepID=UPI003D6FA4C2